MRHESLEQKIRELQESQERYQLAVSGSASGLWDWDILSGTVHYSDRFKELLGYGSDVSWCTPDEFWTRLHPGDTDAVRKAIDEHLKERNTYDIEYRCRTKSGEYRWFHARGQALFDGAGKATRMSGSISDITNRKKVEEELTRSEERFRGLMEQSPLAMEVLTPDGKINAVNPAWKRLWSVTDEEAAQTIAKYNMLTDKQIDPITIMPLVQRAFAGEPVVLPAFRYDTEATGKEVGLEDAKLRSPWIQSYLYPVKAANGEIDHVVNTYIDITDLKEAEQDAREQRDALARVERTTSMGLLSGSISHELNQPLTGILSNAQAAEMMIQGGQNGREELLAIVADIAADAKRAGEVIHTLRDLYREQKGVLSSVDINEIVEETIRLLNSEFVIQCIEATTECDETLPAVNGSKVQIQQVLVNLLINGAQAMSDVASEDRRLHVVTACDANTVQTWVEDCGMGIDEGKIDRIFEPFATWRSGGTGMGLAVSDSIIQAHSGRMFAENRAEGGARVGFKLPVLKRGLA